MPNPKDGTGERWDIGDASFALMLIGMDVTLGSMGLLKMLEITLGRLFEQ